MKENCKESELHPIQRMVCHITTEPKVLYSHPYNCDANRFPQVYFLMRMYKVISSGMDTSLCLKQVSRILNAPNLISKRIIVTESETKCTTGCSRISIHVAAHLLVDKH